MRLLYTPLAIIAGFIAKRLGKATFNSVWARVDDVPPPKPGTGQAGMGKLIAAQALRAGVMAGTAAMVDRWFARAFHHLIGIWPKKPPKGESES